MLPEDSHMAHFRHYIYGVPENPDEDEFLTTMLSLPDAEAWARKHRQMFQSRFDFYSIRQVDVEVSRVR